MTSLPKSPVSPRHGFASLDKPWGHEGEDSFARLEHEFRVWQVVCDAVQESFKQHVYENPRAGEYDYRQHRMRLTAMISSTDDLCSEFLRFTGKADTTPYISALDDKIAFMMNTLWEWHGPVDAKDDIPEEFKRGMAQIAEGKVVDMEKALSQTP